MDRRAFQELIALYDKRITVDIGTGDGLYVYKRAQREPHRLFIGVDANRRPLQKISEKIYRRPAKGGLPNVLFVQAAVEDLPSELEGIATEVLVLFPWGSLLRGVVARDAVVITNLRRICSSNGQLELTIGLDRQRDRSEWERLELPAISTEYIETVLAAKYRCAGLRLVKAEEISWANLAPLQTSWAKRLHHSKSRSIFRIVTIAE